MSAAEEVPQEFLLPEDAKWAKMSYLARESNRTVCRRLVRVAREHECAAAFEQPVDTEKVPDYLSIVKEPISLEEIHDKLLSRAEGSGYDTVADFFHDMNQVWRNCYLYNPRKHPLRSHARQVMEEVWGEFQRWQRRFKRCDDPEAMYCVVCGRGPVRDDRNVLVSCGNDEFGCGRVWHLRCGGPDKAPKKAIWLCPSCSETTTLPPEALMEDDSSSEEESGRSEEAGEGEEGEEEEEEEEEEESSSESFSGGERGASAAKTQRRKDGGRKSSGLAPDSSSRRTGAKSPENSAPSSVRPAAASAGDELVIRDPARDKPPWVCPLRGVFRSSKKQLESELRDMARHDTRADAARRLIRSVERFALERAGNIARALPRSEVERWPGFRRVFLVPRSALPEGGEEQQAHLPRQALSAAQLERVYAKMEEERADLPPVYHLPPELPPIGKFRSLKATAQRQIFLDAIARAKKELEQEQKATLRRSTRSRSSPRRRAASSQGSKDEEGEEAEEEEGEEEEGEEGNGEEAEEKGGGKGEEAEEKPGKEEEVGEEGEEEEEEEQDEEDDEDEDEEDENGAKSSPSRSRRKQRSPAGDSATVRLVPQAFSIEEDWAVLLARYEAFEESSLTGKPVISNAWIQTRAMTLSKALRHRMALSSAAHCVKDRLVSLRRAINVMSAEAGRKLDISDPYTVIRTLNERTNTREWEWFNDVLHKEGWVPRPWRDVKPIVRQAHGMIANNASRTGSTPRALRRGRSGKGDGDVEDAADAQPSARVPSTLVLNRPSSQQLSDPEWIPLASAAVGTAPPSAAGEQFSLDEPRPFLHHPALAAAAALYSMTRPALRRPLESNWDFMPMCDRETKMARGWCSVLSPAVAERVGLAVERQSQWWKRQQSNDEHDDGDDGEAGHAGGAASDPQARDDWGDSCARMRPPPLGWVTAGRPSGRLLLGEEEWGALREPFASQMKPTWMKGLAPDTVRRRRVILRRRRGVVLTWAAHLLTLAPRLAHPEAEDVSEEEGWRRREELEKEDVQVIAAATQRGNGGGSSLVRQAVATLEKGEVETKKKEEGEGGAKAAQAPATSTTASRRNSNSREYVPAGSWLIGGYASAAAAGFAPLAPPSLPVAAPPQPGPASLEHVGMTTLLYEMGPPSEPWPAPPPHPGAFRRARPWLEEEDRRKATEGDSQAAGSATRPPPAKRQRVDAGDASQIAQGRQWRVAPGSWSGQMASDERTERLREMKERTTLKDLVGTLLDAGEVPWQEQLAGLHQLTPEHVERIADARMQAESYRGVW